MKDCETKNSGLILPLQGLRGILFLVIFFFHSENFLKGYAVYDRFLIGGCISVSVFFVLSGFVNGLSSKCILSWHEYMQFLKKALGKFYLTHIVFLILSLPVSYYFLIYTLKGKLALLLDILLLQSWFSDKDVWLSYNGVTWFLSTLMFCYIMLPVIQWLWGRLEKHSIGKQRQIIYFSYLILTYGASTVSG